MAGRENLVFPACSSIEVILTAALPSFSAARIGVTCRDVPPPEKTPLKHRWVNPFTTLAAPAATWRLIKVFLLLGITLATFSTHAEIYKWVDDEGNTHFGDKAPASGNAKVINAEATRIGTTFSPSSVNSTIPSSTTGAPPNGASTAGAPASGATGTSGPQNAEPPPVVATTPPQATEMRPRTSAQNGSNEANSTDLCKNAVGACFNETQDNVCKLRYGARCDTVYFWKVCRYQRCENERWTDKCNSTFDYIVNRPPMIGKRDLHRVFPLQNLVSAADWKCLSTSGFYCDELTNEDICQANYHQSCEQLRHWVDTVKSHCNESRDNNCEDISNLLRYRPIPDEEAKKGKIKMAHDLWMEELNIVRESDATEAQFKPLLEALPGLNLGVTKEQHECHLPEH